ncbi:class I SAM-dependent methyltransferase [Phosphitispora sp. TUW77]|uniref:class I SAM-dependent methyltransferase n=1 Tax=Phosphitispora sp. TUW77 TaxID=3152361 RepID=UPI003AB1A2CD
MEDERKNSIQGDFWAKAWQEASCQKRNNRISKNNIEKTVAVWNNRAESFARNTAKEGNRARTQAVFDFLDFCGVNIDGITILDIGCGPGNYTIPLAKRAAHIWALDPAVAMLDILKEKAEKTGVDNITYINKPWEDINLQDEGWLNKFDLVFASMSPGVNDRKTLEKMIDASKQYCFISKFAGQRRNNLHDKLWRLVFREDLSDLSMDIIFPFNLVYSLGYFPSLKFIASNWVNEDSAEETIVKLRDWLSGYTDITPELSKTIQEFVLAESVGGQVKEEVKANNGMMIWQV